MLTCQAVALAACACARWESGRAGIARSEGRLREALPGGVVCLQHFQLCSVMAKIPVLRVTFAALINSPPRASALMRAVS